MQKQLRKNTLSFAFVAVIDVGFRLFFVEFRPIVALKLELVETDF
jgi:hypothetical protein